MKKRLILGPPGTGKTRHLLRLTKRLKGKKLFLTHTKAAANEMRARLGDASKDVKITTIHALAYSVLPKAAVLDTDTLSQFGKEYMYTFGNGEGVVTTGDLYLKTYYQTKTTPIWKIVDGPHDFHLPGFMRFAAQLDDFKEKNALIDFHDMLIQATGNVNNDFDHIFVDEAQDLSKSQWLFLEALLKKGNTKTLTIVGDDDQSIYSFNGAYTQGMFEFGAKIRYLKHSKRLPLNVYLVAKDLLSKMKNRHVKVLWPVQKHGTVDFAVSPFHVKHSDTEDTLWLYRTHAARTQFIDALMHMHVPFETLNGLPGPLQHPALKAVEVFEDIRNGKSTLTLTKAQKKHIKKMYLDHPEIDGTWEDYLDISPKHLDYLMAVKWVPGKKVDVHHKLSTMHGAKGLEADHVVLLNSNTTYKNKGLDQPIVDEEELRIFFVGVTRAKQRLTIVEGPSPMPLKKIVVDRVTGEW